MDIEKEKLIAAIKDKAEKNEWTENDIGRIYNILIRHPTDTEEELVDQETLKKYLIRGWWFSQLLEEIDYNKEKCPLCTKNVVHQTDQKVNTSSEKIHNKYIDDPE